MTHSRLIHTPSLRFKIGDVVLFSMDDQYQPMQIQAILPKAYGDDDAYAISSINFPSAQLQPVAGRYLRPMIRTRSDMKSILRLVK